MRKRSKILAIILSVAMVGSMWSPVFAEETTDTVGETVVQETADEEAVEEEAVIEPVAEAEAPVEVTEEVQPDAVDVSGYTVVDVDFDGFDAATETIQAAEVKSNDGGATTVKGEYKTVSNPSKSEITDCTKGSTWTFSYTASNGTTYSHDVEGSENGTAKSQHTYDKGNYGETHVTDAATHEKAGKGYKLPKCDVCGLESTDESKKLQVTVEKLSHTWGTTTYQIPVNESGVYTGTDSDSDGYVNNLKVKKVKVGKNSDIELLVLDGTELKDKTQPGYYVEARICTEFDGSTDKGIENVTTFNSTTDITFDKSVKKTVSPTEAEEVGLARITSAEGIKKIAIDSTTYYAGVSQGANLVLKNGVYTPIEEKYVVLNDCDVAGTYTVTYWNTTYDKVIRTQEFTVAAHHNEATYVEFASATDAGNVTRSWEDGVPTVTSNTCEKSISYNLVTVCTNPTCKKTTYTVPTNGVVYKDGNVTVTNPTNVKLISSTSATAAASTNHSSLKDKVDAAIKGITAEKTYAEIYNKITNKNIVIGYDKKFVEITPSETDCTKAGTATIKYYCTICGKALDDQTETVAYVGQDEHTMSTSPSVVSDKTTAATCTEEGKLTTKVKCTNPGCEYAEETTTTIPTIKHTNETIKGTGDTSNGEESQQYLAIEGTTIIDTDGSFANAKGTTTDVYAELVKTNGDVSAYVYTLCTACGGNKVTLTGAANTPKVTVSSVTKEGAECKPGSITLVATWTGKYIDNKTEKSISLSETKTFEYYSSALAYQGRKSHTVGETKKENEVAATETTNGSYDLVTYCSICGSVIKTEHVTVAATGVKLPAVQNLKAETKSMNRVKLTWDKLDGAIGYIVLGLNETGRYGNQIAYTTQTSWTDTAADSEAYNFYWVVGVSKNAENKNVVGELGSYVYAIGRVVGATTNLAAKTASNGVTLTWTKASNANGYVILSRKGRTGKANKLTSVGDVASYTDTTADGTTFYWVYGTYTNEEGKTVVAGATSNYAYATK